MASNINSTSASSTISTQQAVNSSSSMAAQGKTPSRDELQALFEQTLAGIKNLDERLSQASSITNSTLLTELLSLPETIEQRLVGKSPSEIVQTINNHIEDLKKHDARIEEKRKKPIYAALLKVVNDLRKACVQPNFPTAEASAILTATAQQTLVLKQILLRLDQGLDPYPSPKAHPRRPNFPKPTHSLTYIFLAAIGGLALLLGAGLLYRMKVHKGN